MPDPLDAFPRFAREALGRLDAGRRRYADRNLQAHPADLLAELEEECLDLAGWGFVLWTRVRQLRDAAEAAAAEAGGEDAA